MRRPPVRPWLRPLVLDALDADPQLLADVCGAVGRDPKDRSVRRVLDSLAADGEAVRSVDGWATRPAGHRGADGWDGGDNEPAAPPPDDIDAEAARRLAALAGRDAEALRALAEMADRDAEWLGPALAALADCDAGAEALRALHGPDDEP